MFTPNMNNSSGGGNGSWMQGIPVLGGILDGIFGRNAAKKNFQRQARFARKEADKARAYNTEFWNMQNEYNTPARQMERWKEAGLNPHLIYGQGETGNAELARYQAPSTPNAEVQPFQFQGGISNLMQWKQLESTIKLQNSQANLNNVEAGLEPKKTESLINLQSNQGKSLLSGILVEQSLLGLNMQQIRSQIGLNKSQMKKIGQEVVESVARVDKISQDIEHTKEQIKNLQSQRFVMYLDGQLKKAQRELTLSQVQTEGIRRKLMDSNANLNLSELLAREGGFTWTDSSLNRTLGEMIGEGKNFKNMIKKNTTKWIGDLFRSGFEWVDRNLY